MLTSLLSLLPGRPSRRPRVAFVRFRNMQWLFIGSLIGIYLLNHGTAHLLWSYEWSGDHANPVYYRCTYIGRDTQTIVPADGKCPLVMLLKTLEEEPSSWRNQHPS